MGVKVKTLVATSSVRMLNGISDFSRIAFRLLDFRLSLHQVLFQ